MALTLKQAMEKLARPAHLKQGLRACIAALVAFGVGTALQLPNSYWAVLTAVLVVQSTVGASLSVAIERTLGTLVGGVVGVAASVLAGTSQPLTFLALALGILITSTLAARSSAYKLAPVTVVIVLLAEASHASPWISALFRLMEIAIGGMAGVLCAVLILPARALIFLFPHCAEAVRNCARLMTLGRDGLLGHPYFPDTVDALNSRTRTVLRAADGRAKEAHTEQRWSGQMDPAPVVRSCRRLWHSVIIMLRNAERPLPETLRTHIGPELDRAVQALCAYMEALSAHMEDGPMDMDAGMAARISVEALEARADSLNAAHALDAASGADLTALFATISACTHVRNNLEDLALRLTELRVPERRQES
ncbi:FUSC family protein [Xanthobacter sp. TB0139]|uniref:FUSC family protein n=1 Tax=Xanthobacter sp. TB0139 TaxID=3459178 RepID=UPI00403A3A95